MTTDRAVTAAGEQIGRQRNPATGRHSSVPGQDALLEIQHRRVVELERRHALRQAKAERPAVQPGAEQHHLLASGAHRTENPLIVERRALREVKPESVPQARRIIIDSRAELGKISVPTLTMAPYLRRFVFVGHA